MWYSCEAMGQSNRVDQSKLLQKITVMKYCDFCKDMSKSKNANRVLLIIYLDLNVLLFCVFESNYSKLLKRMEKGSKYRLV